MSAQKALLMEISYPHSDEALYLMSGHGFEVLRTDNTGREIYGVAHEGREYLFFPFSFKPLDAGILTICMPQEYEESCLDHRADGARIIFSAQHGTPFFADMPEEYQTNTGIIRIEKNGEMRVLLDKAKEVEPPSAQSACSCGHDHAHAHEHHHDDACGCAAPKQTDEQLAALLREKATALNLALRQAADAGLLTTLELTEEKCPKVRIVQILRSL